MTDTDQTNSQTNEADDGWILGTDPLLRSWVGKWVDTRLPGASSTFAFSGVLGAPGYRSQLAGHHSEAIVETETGRRSVLLDFGRQFRLSKPERSYGLSARLHDGDGPVLEPGKVVVEHRPASNSGDASVWVHDPTPDSLFQYIGRDVHVYASMGPVSSMRVAAGRLMSVGYGDRPMLEVLPENGCPQRWQYLGNLTMVEVLPMQQKSTLLTAVASQVEPAVATHEPILWIGDGDERHPVGVPQPGVDRSAMTSKQVAEELAADPVHGWRVLGHGDDGVTIDLSPPRVVVSTVEVVNEPATLAIGARVFVDSDRSDVRPGEAGVVVDVGDTESVIGSGHAERLGASMIRLARMLGQNDDRRISWYIDELERQSHWAGEPLLPVTALRFQIAPCGVDGEATGIIERVLELLMPISCDGEAMGLHDEAMAAYAALGNDGQYTRMREPKRDRWDAIAERWAVRLALKLRANASKGGWENDTWRDLMTRVDEEMDELRKALRLGAFRYGSGSEAISEATDVANMVMMLADVIEGGTYDMGGELDAEHADAIAVQNLADASYEAIAATVAKSTPGWGPNSASELLERESERIGDAGWVVGMNPVIDTWVGKRIESIRNAEKIIQGLLVKVEPELAHVQLESSGWVMLIRSLRIFRLVDTQPEPPNPSRDEPEPAEVDASLPTIQLDGSDPVRMFNGEPVIGGCLEVEEDIMEPPSAAEFPQGYSYSFLPMGGGRRKCIVTNSLGDVAFAGCERTTHVAAMTDLWNWLKEHSEQLAATDPSARGWSFRVLSDPNRVVAAYKGEVRFIAHATGKWTESTLTVSNEVRWHTWRIAAAHFGEVWKTRELKYTEDSVTTVTSNGPSLAVLMNSKTPPKLFSWAEPDDRRVAEDPANAKPIVWTRLAADAKPATASTPDEIVALFERAAASKSLIRVVAEDGSEHEGTARYSNGPSRDGLPRLGVATTTTRWFSPTTEAHGLWKDQIVVEAEMLGADICGPLVFETSAPKFDLAVALRAEVVVANKQVDELAAKLEEEQRAHAATQERLAQVEKELADAIAILDPDLSALGVDQ